MWPCRANTFAGPFSDSAEQKLAALPHDLQRLIGRRSLVASQDRWAVRGFGAGK